MFSQNSNQGKQKSPKDKTEGRSWVWPALLAMLSYVDLAGYSWLFIEQVSSKISCNCRWLGQMIFHGPFQLHLFCDFLFLFLIFVPVYITRTNKWTVIKNKKTGQKISCHNINCMIRRYKCIFKGGSNCIPDLRTPNYPRTSSVSCTEGDFYNQKNHKGPGDMRITPLFYRKRNCVLKRQYGMWCFLFVQWPLIKKKYSNHFNTDFSFH